MADLAREVPLSKSPGIPTCPEPTCPPKLEGVTLNLETKLKLVIVINLDVGTY